MDFIFTPDGFHFIVSPQNEVAAQWLKENTDGQWFGRVLFVEGNYASGLAEGMRSDSFTVEGI